MLKTKLETLRRQSLLVYSSGILVTLLLIFVCVLQLETAISAYTNSFKEKMEVNAGRSDAAISSMTGAIRRDRRSIASFWSGLAGKGIDERVLMYEELAEFMANSARATKLPIYVLNANRQLIFVMSEPGKAVHWTGMDGRVPVASAAAINERIQSYVSAWSSQRDLGNKSFPQWIGPYMSPLTAELSISALTAVKDSNDDDLGYLIFEQPIRELASLIAWNGGRGEYFLRNASGELLWSSLDSQPEADVHAVLEAGSTGVIQNGQVFYKNGYLLTAWDLASTQWRLVYALSLHDIWTAIRRPILGSVLSCLGVIGLVWGCLFMLRRKVFEPAPTTSTLVQNNEYLSTLLIQSAPLSLAVISVETGQPLFCSERMKEVTAHAGIPFASLSAQWHKRFLNYEQFPTGTDSGPLNFYVSLANRDGLLRDYSINLARVRDKETDVLVVSLVDFTVLTQETYSLREALRAADAANAATTSFLTSASHEVRTFLNGILGNLELLTHSQQDPLERDRLNSIRSASNTLLAIVGDVLDISKIEAGELHLERETLDVHEVVARAMSLFSPLASAKGLELVAEMGPSPQLFIRGDATRLSQVLNNLLANAIKFTVSGRVTIRVSLGDDARSLLVSVTDTGIGMTAGQLSDIFRPFFQANSPPAQGRGGTGLGLTICAQLVKAMGGDLTASSELGQGSCFEMKLMLDEVARPSQMPVFSGQDVLFLSHEPNVHVCRVLEAWGLHVRRGHPTSSSLPVALHESTIVILWGQYTNHEDLVGGGVSWVVECKEEGPSQPIAVGKRIKVSAYGLLGLLQAVEYGLAQREIIAKQQTELTCNLSFKVLVVDDHKATRSLLREQLLLLGCEVAVARNGYEALQKLAGFSCDVLLTDLGMPGMDGQELVSRVRGLRADMPILIVTADVTEQKICDFDNDPYTLVLGKPLMLISLYKALTLATAVDHVSTAERFCTEAPTLDGRALPIKLRSTLNAENMASLQVLRRAWARGDIDRVKSVLHTLRGALGMFGMRKLAKQGASLAEAISRGDYQSCHADFIRFCFDLKRSIHPTLIQEESFFTRRHEKPKISRHKKNRKIRTSSKD